MIHVRAVALLLGAVGVALAAIVALASLGAERAAAGEDVIALFADRASGGAAIAQLDASMVRAIEPLGIANGWLVQPGAPYVAQSLRAHGALLVLRADGLLHFALGCAVVPPAAGRAWITSPGSRANLRPPRPQA